jgi:hypothetical protein
MKKSELEQEQLIREYVRAAIIAEYAPPGAMGAALRRAVSEPAKRLASVISGKSKQLFASLKNVAKIAWGALKELGTLGLLSANYDKIKEEYEGELRNIEKKHGADIRHARETFFNDFSPLVGVAKAGLTGAAATAFFMNPLLFMAGTNVASAAAEKVPGLKKDIDKKIDKMAYGEDYAKEKEEKERRAREKDSRKEEKQARKREKQRRREERDARRRSAEPPVSTLPASSAPVENLLRSKNPLNEEKTNPNAIMEKHPWLKDAMNESKRAMMKYAAKIDSEVKSTVSASKLEDLGIPKDVIKKITSDPKAKQEDVLAAAKAMKLGEILAKVEAERNQTLSSTKQAFPNVPESSYTGAGSMIHAYDVIINKIKSSM